MFNDSGLLQGTLELLVLKTLSWGPMHGYGIASWIESATGDVLRVEEGSLYPALYRMTRKGWLEAEVACRRTTGAPSTTASPPRGGGSSASRSAAGSASPPR
jgi:DNA-binding PadR family transcriptional regulator